MKTPEVKAAEEADRVQLVEALAEHPGTPWGEAIEKVAALRIEHAAWGAAIDGLRTGLATVSRERDEARVYIDDTGKRIGVLQRLLCNNDSALPQDIRDTVKLGHHVIDEAARILLMVARERDEARADMADGRIGNAAWGAFIDELRASLATVTRERDEARETSVELHRRLTTRPLAVCAYCAAPMPETDPMGASPEERMAWMDAHMRTCPEHPMSAVTRERDELRATLQHLRDIAHGALSGNSTAPDVEDAIARADAALAAGGKA